MIHEHDKVENRFYSHDLPSTPMDAAFIEAEKDKISVAMVGLCGCWGCHLSFLDMDEAILDVLSKCTINRSSFTDLKRIPSRTTVGFVEGGVSNEETITQLIEFRENCDILISVGACAVWGGVPAMRNMVPLEECFDVAYFDSCTAVEGAKPVVPNGPEIPFINTKVLPCHEVVKMDYFIPGCPPDGAAILKVLDDLINGREVDLPKAINRYD